MKKEGKIILKAEKEIVVRFSEVDSMHIVWHGSYANYFEDAREEFGRKYGIGYLDVSKQGYYIPLVELNFNYKKPLIYGDKALVEITYEDSAAAKIIYNYRILSLTGETVLATGRSVQVFLDRDYNLMWITPEFYLDWKRKNGLI